MILTICQGKSSGADILVVYQVEIQVSDISPKGTQKLFFLFWRWGGVPAADKSPVNDSEGPMINKYAIVTIM